MTTKNEIIEAEAKTSSLDLIKDENKLKTEKHNALAVVHEVLHNKEKPVIVNGKRHLEFEDWVIDDYEIPCSSDFYAQGLNI